MSFLALSVGPYAYHIWKSWSISSYSIIVKPMKTPELHYLNNWTYWVVKLTLSQECLDFQDFHRRHDYSQQKQSFQSAKLLQAQSSNLLYTNLMSVFKGHLKKYRISQKQFETYSAMIRSQISKAPIVHFGIWRVARSCKQKLKQIHNMYRWENWFPWKLVTMSTMLARWIAKLRKNLDRLTFNTLSSDTKGNFSHWRKTY